MRVLGIDLGSREVKIVVMEDKSIVLKSKISTIEFYRKYCSHDGRLKVDMKKLGVENIDIGISTGYGRNNTDLADFQTINELKAHVYGALFQIDSEDFVLLDIGGQDMKIVKVEKGIITDLDLNEKCAASSGRYLENMANVLDLSLEEMSSHYANPVDINSTCAVFSEISLIGLIAQGVEAERLCAGVNYSLYKRIRPLINKVGGCSRLILSGGVALNQALQHYLQDDYDEVVVLRDPQFNGAIGCCYYACKIEKV